MQADGVTHYPQTQVPQHILTKVNSETRLGLPYGCFSASGEAFNLVTFFQIWCHSLFAGTSSEFQGLKRWKIQIFKTSYKYKL